MGLDWVGMFHEKTETKREKIDVIYYYYYYK